MVLWLQSNYFVGIAISNMYTSLAETHFLTGKHAKLLSTLIIRLKTELFPVSYQWKWISFVLDCCVWYRHWAACCMFVVLDTGTGLHAVCLLCLIQALGCMLYEMCALKPAYDGNNLISLIFRIVKEAPKARTSSFTVFSFAFVHVLCCCQELC